MMYVALAFVFSMTLVSFVIWPKIFVWFRDTYMGGPPKKAARLSITAPTATRVSGIQAPSDYSASIMPNSPQQFDTTASIRSAAEAQKVKHLEKEVETLKRRLSEQNSTPMSSLVERGADSVVDPEQPEQRQSSVENQPSNDQMNAENEEDKDDVTESVEA